MQGVMMVSRQQKETILIIPNVWQVLYYYFNLWQVSLTTKSGRLHSTLAGSSLIWQVLQNLPDNLLGNLPEKNVSFGRLLSIITPRPTIEILISRSFRISGNRIKPLYRYFFDVLALLFLLNCQILPKPRPPVPTVWAEIFLMAWH